MSDMTTPLKSKQLVAITNKETGAVETFDIITGELVYLEGQLVKDHDFAYTIPQALLIADKIREGKTLQDVGSMADMPSLTLICAWKRNHPDFAKLLQDAKKDRAEYCRDKAQEVLEQADNDNIKVDKLKFDGYLKLAEKDNPEEYGKSKAGEGSGGVTIVVNTGIVRSEPDIVVEATKISEEDDDGK